MKSGIKLVIAGAVVFLALCNQTAYCQPAVSIMVQQTPVNGGEVTPKAGVHSFSLGEQVVITAVAKPGYRFIYWVGDVPDPTSNSNIINANSPQIIIAVFERDAYESVSLKDYEAYSGANPYTFPSPYESGSGGGGEGAKRPHKYYPPAEPTPEEQNDFPVPRPPDDEFPVPEPIPEPTTILLMGFGSLITVITRRNKERTCRSIKS